MSLPPEGLRDAPLARDYHRGVTTSPADEYPMWVRITGIIAFAVAVSVAAVFLGHWQYHRYEVRAEALHQYELGQQEDPRPINDLIPPGSVDLPAHTQWREAVLVGQFEPESTTVLRNRPVDRRPSWQYLAWFDTTDGRSMLVNLGWIPLPGPDDDPAPPPYPTSETTITVITRTWEDDDGKRGDGATRVTPEQVPAPTYNSVPGYGMLRQVCADGQCANVVVGEQTPLPSLSTGPHLSYAWQWWVLAAMAPVGAVIMIRRERADDADGDAVDRDAAEPVLDSGGVGASGRVNPRVGEAAIRATPPSASRRRSNRRLSDEEVEDAL
jgi:cytochrome oxidase assembly protein ShyY1